MQISSSPVSLFVGMVASEGDASDYVTVVGSFTAPQAEPELARQTCSPIYCGKSLETRSREALAQAIAALNHMYKTRPPALNTRIRGTGIAH